MNIDYWFMVFCTAVILLVLGLVLLELKGVKHELDYVAGFMNYLTEEINRRITRRDN